jgi:hypothetical protein
VKGDVVRWRVMPHGGSVRLEVELVGVVLTEHVHVLLSVDGARELAAQLVACGADVAGQGSRSDRAAARALTRGN